MAIADGLCGVVAGGVTVSVHIKIEHTVEQLNTIWENSGRFIQHRQLLGFTCMD